VRTAEAALGKLVTERPDAIIVDVHLPGMSGIEFLRESGVLLVAVSDVASESQARECLRLISSASPSRSSADDAFSFVNLTSAETERLQQLVRRFV
jgi:CheY-like chemotaxis protein